MLDALDTKTLDASQPPDTLQELRDALKRMQAELKFKQTRIEALNFEVARLKRWRFGSSSESLETSTQAVLFDHILIDTAFEDRAAQDATNPAPSPSRTKGQAFKRIGQEISEQLDCVPAQFFVLRHIRGKYACAYCQTIAAAPMPAQMIDKGIAAPGLLAQVALAKHDDHLPPYRQEEMCARSGVHIARSSMAQWLGICGVRLAPLALALKRFILDHAEVHAGAPPPRRSTTA